MADKTQTPDRILRLPAVMDRVGLRQRAIYSHIKKGTFPKSTPLGGRAVGWFESEITQWLEALKASRDQAA